MAIAFLGPGGKGTFEAETAARDGSTFYVCAFAVDGDDRMVGFGQYERNPVVVHAADRAEVEIEGVDVVLRHVRLGNCHLDGTGEPASGFVA